MTYDSWQNQGRQQHGWFGHGTSPHDDKPDGPEATAPDAPGHGASIGAVYRPLRNADGDRAAPVIQASMALAVPAIEAMGVTAGAVIGGLTLPEIALLLAVGWGLYELMPEYDSRLIHEVELSGHPEIAAVMDETQRKVAFAIPGPPGKPASVVVWDLKIPLPSVFSGGALSPEVVDQQGQRMGVCYLYGSRTILLSKAGDKALQEAAEQGGGATEPQDGETKVSTDPRNRGLPEELWTKGGYREAAIANDKPLQEAIEKDKTSAKTDEEKLTKKDVSVHHVIPMQAVRDNPEVFLDGEWRPDRLDNTMALPKDEPAQAKIKQATGEKRPIHKGGHESWNNEVQEEIDKMKKEIGDKDLKRGDPGYREAVKKGLDDVLQRMRERLRHRDVVLNDEPHQGVA